jgi:hypothetical protein
VVVDPVRTSRETGQIAHERWSSTSLGFWTRTSRCVRDHREEREGFANDVVCTVTENAKTLKFDQHGFEET